MRALLFSTTAPGGGQDVLRRAVILLQADGLGVRIIAFEIENIADIGAAPTVDGLVLVAYHADIAVLFGEQAHQFVLAAVGVLILVDHDVAQAAVPGFARGVVVAQQAHGFEQQIVEIERVGIAQGLLVFLVERCHGLGLRVDGLLVDIGRRLLQILRMADARERRAVLHELFLVEAKPAVGGFDNGELVFVVVNGEPAGEAGAHARERIAIAAQQAHAEGVKRRKRGVGIKPHVREQRGDALAHFGRGLIGERNGEDRRRRHVALGDDVRDAMSDDASFSAASTGEDKQRTFRVAHRFSLLRVEPF